MSSKKSLPQVLHDRGRCLTPQRMPVVEAIEDSDDHISAEGIYGQAQARYAYMNISTVYRTLDLLKELDLVTETDLRGRRLPYHPAGKAYHHHLYAENVVMFRTSMSPCCAGCRRN